MAICGGQAPGVRPPGTARRATVLVVRPYGGRSARLRPAEQTRPPASSREPKTRPMPTTLTVTHTETLTPNLRRVWFRSDDLSAFAESTYTDRYVKIIFLKPGVDYPEPLDMRALRGVLAPEDMPTVRTYTALFPDVEQGTLAIDFVIHGDEGVAGPWAPRRAG